MDNNYFLQTFEDVNEGTLPAPLIRHSHECRSFNNRRRWKGKKGVTSTADPYLADPIHAEDDRNDNEEENSEGCSSTYMCINTNKYNGKCYHKKMAVISDLHLHLTLGEALTYLLNFYLQKRIINRNFYNRLLNSFQLVKSRGTLRRHVEAQEREIGQQSLFATFFFRRRAIIDTLNDLKDSKETRWRIKGTLLNSKKENNIHLLCVENAFLSLNKIVLHLPLLKIKSIDV
ncbi:conserved Plasmodium protein, unknown function [Plasmodium ovale curtisi]|uniref:Uncharacterized protein n=1 Tax=Plasmodium ovale curtisi TaxID=864141 RepID=A0A1A8VRV6_PLAOA|nr:conserved Plasmodium protein, unknown function [Plasmodium ovale curtisi]